MAAIAVTEAADAREADRNRAKETADKLCLPFLTRKKRSLPMLFAVTGFAYLIVMHKNGTLSLHSRDERDDEKGFIYHPGLALPRIKAMMQGQDDKLMRVAGITPGDVVIDATAGLCSDAVVFSYAVGDLGRCLAFEASQPLALVVAHGLQTYQGVPDEVKDAMRRVELLHARFEDALQMMPDRSVDVVYLDPMFEQTIKRSSAMAMLKPFAVPPTSESPDLFHPMRIARKKVVIKIRRHTPYVHQLKDVTIAAGSGSTTYAILG